MELGDNVSAVVCSTILRRPIGGIFCRPFIFNLQDLFEPFSRYGVSVWDDVELVIKLPTIGHQMGGTILHRLTV